MAYAVQLVGYALTRKFSAGTRDLRTQAGTEYISDGDLQGWWRLNENVDGTGSNTGDVTDSSGNGRAGTFDLDAERPIRSTLTPSARFMQDASCHFRGLEDSGADGVNIGSGTTWNAIIGNATGGTSQVTVSVWIYKIEDGGSDNGTIWSFGIGSNSYGGLTLYSTSENRLTFDTWWGGAGGNRARWRTQKGVFKRERWHHIVLTYDARDPGNEPIIYVNGRVPPNSGWNGDDFPPADSTWDGISEVVDFTNCYIGSQIFGSDDISALGFNGMIADVAVWNSVLSPHEVAALATVRSTGAYLVTRNYNLRGSIATLSSSIDSFRQGVSVRSMAQRYVGMSPKLAAGSAPRMVIDNKLIEFQDTIFDETNQPPRISKILSGSSIAALSGSTTSLNSARGIISFIPNHEMVRRDFGQPKLFKDNEPYEDMSKWDPVVFISNCEEYMIYPYVLANASMRDPEQMDGVIEPLAIRSRASRNSIDWPYEAHSVWGLLLEGAEDSRRRSCPIVQQIDLQPTNMEPFEDGGYEFMGFTPLSGSVLSGSLPYGAIVSNYGYLHDNPAVINPWLDTSDREEAYAPLLKDPVASGSYNNTLAIPFDRSIYDALMQVTSSIDDLTLRHHKSAPAGYDYLDAEDGTDSIVFGGWKK